MSKEPNFYPYIIGIAVGFFMTLSALIGFRLIRTSPNILGNTLIFIGLIAYPLYTTLILGYTIILKKRQMNHLIKPWIYSIFIVPIGAVFAVFALVLIYQIVEGGFL